MIFRNYRERERRDLRESRGLEREREEMERMRQSERV